MFGGGGGTNRLGRATEALYLEDNVSVLTLPDDLPARVDVCDRAISQTKLPSVRDIMGRESDIVGLK